MDTEDNYYRKLMYDTIKGIVLVSVTFGAGFYLSHYHPDMVNSAYSWVKSLLI